MDNLNRCPACFKVPVFHFNQASNLWQGGCQSYETRLCSDLQNVVLQPDLEQAVAQWEDVIKPFSNLYSKAA